MDPELDPDLEPVMISALEHYSYCPRQCALIHMDQVYDENTFTLRGSYNHERVDRSEVETRPDIRREYAMPLWSQRLGLVGRADLVEFTEDGPYPVEHKSGRRRQWGHEAIQLCAQALCLEEMLATPVPRGAIYYRGSRNRREIELDEALRRTVEQMTSAVRAMLAGTTLPAPVHDQRCRHCSLIDSCMPGVSRNTEHERRAARALFELEASVPASRRAHTT